MGYQTGELLSIDISGAVVFGAIALLSAVVYVVHCNQHNEMSVQDDEKERCRKKKEIGRKYVAGFGALAHATLAVGYCFLLAKVGYYRRDCDEVLVNWTFFAFAAVAFFFVGMMHSLVFWIEGLLNRTAFSALFALSLMFLAVGPTSCVERKRDASFAMAAVLQGVSLAFALYFSGDAKHGSSFMRHKGWLGVWLSFASVVLTFAVYDIFWYIGYLNVSSSSVMLNAPWKSELAFLLASVLALPIGGVIDYVFYKAKKMVQTGDYEEAPLSTAPPPPPSSSSVNSLLPAMYA